MNTITTAPVTTRCPCYRCSEPIYEWDQDTAMQFVVNNLHDELRPCEICGRAKTEHVDRYTWGYYECWWCNERAAGSWLLPAAAARVPAAVESADGGPR